MHIVCKYRGIVAGPRDRDVPEARIEQVRVDAGVGAHQHALRSEPLGDGEA